MDRSAPTGQGLRALVVDDEPAIRSLLRTVLELEGWSVSEAGDGEAALRCVADDPPHAIVLDVMLPGLDGFQVLSEVRRGDQGRSLAVVLLTAKDQPADVRRGTRLGADQYLTKPCDPDVVAERLLFHARRRHPAAGSPAEPLRR